MTLLYHYSNPKFDGLPWPANKEPKKKKPKTKKTRTPEQIAERRKNRKKHREEQFKHLVTRAQPYLQAFWRKFNEQTTIAGRLALLREYSRPPWDRVSGRMRRWCRKDKEHHISILFDRIGPQQCGVCEKRAEEKHHILPCCYGGPTVEWNILLICMGCHDAIHPWMREEKGVS